MKPLSFQRPRRRHLITSGRLLALAILVMVGSVFAPIVFVATQCYGDGFQPPMRRPPAARDIPNYTRDEAYTYLALPQWVIIYSTDEYARHIAAASPSSFPYFRAIAQFWRQYGGACSATQNRYAFDGDVHSVLGVAGLAFSVESAIKGVYENTVGRLTELVGSRETAEDAFAARVAAEYATFMHTEPWYEYPFADQLVSLWTQTTIFGSSPIRKLERRLALTAELGVKTVHASIVGLGAAVAYASENPQIHVWIERAPDSVFADPEIVRVAAVGPQAYIVRVPRYEAFTQLILSLHAKGVRFVSIGGNDDILITVIKTQPQGIPPAPARVLSEEPLLTDASRSRVALTLPVASLNDVIAYVTANEGTVEHVYDY